MKEICKHSMRKHRRMLKRTSLKSNVIFNNKIWDWKKKLSSRSKSWNIYNWRQRCMKIRTAKKWELSVLKLKVINRLPSNNLNKTKRLKCWKPKSTFLNQTWAKLSPILKKKGNWSNSKMSRLSKSKMRSSNPWPKATNWKSEKVKIWRRLVKWYWTRGLTSSNSSWRRWNKSKKKSVENWRLREMRSSRNSKNKSMLDSNNSLTMMRSPMWLRPRLRWSWLILIGRIEREFSDCCSLKWILARAPRIGEINMDRRRRNQAQATSRPDWDRASVNKRKKTTMTSKTPPSSKRQPSRLRTTTEQLTSPHSTTMKRAAAPDTQVNTDRRLRRNEIWEIINE